MKKLCRIVFFVFLVLTSSNLACFSAPVYDYEHGRFEFLTPSPLYLPFDSRYVMQSEDGHVYFIDMKANIIEFKPKTNTFEKLARLDSCSADRPDPTRAILLKNGKILLVSPITKLPSSEFSYEFKEIIRNNKIPEIRGVNFKNRVHNFYVKMSEIERISALLPYIKKDPDLYKRYREYAHCFNESMYGQIFDPATRTFEKTGKINIRRNVGAKVLLSDNRVLLFRGYEDEDEPDPFEIFDPDTKKFTLLDEFLHGNDSYTTNEILLNNGNVLITSYDGVFIFDPYSVHLDKVSSSVKMKFNAIKLCGKKDTIIYRDWFTDNLKLYDVEKNTATYFADFLINRGFGYSSWLSLLPDNNIMVSGGHNDEREVLEHKSDIPESRVELIYTKTGQIKLIPSRTNDEFYLLKPLVLKDGRIVFWFRKNTEIYIPKGYDKK